MARPLRIEFKDALYHLWARGNARQAVFHDESDRARFLELLIESAQRFEAAILCFVLMGNHFHLVGQTHRPNLRRWNALAAGLLHGVFQSAASHERSCSRGATRVFSYKRAIIFWV
jgi:REP element-mobilizing transposase RayT